MGPMAGGRVTELRAVTKLRRFGANLLYLRPMMAISEAELEMGGSEVRRVVSICRNRVSVGGESSAAVWPDYALA